MSKLLLGHIAGALKRISLQKSLREQAEKDSLTGVYNRRYFNNFIDREIERSKRYKYFITFIMIDIDRFKEINDRFGHQMGDEVLKGIGHILEAQIRKIDTLVRYGGDEFLIVLPEADDKNINGFISRLKKTVNNSRYLSFEPRKRLMLPSTLETIISCFPDIRQATIFINYFIYCFMYYIIINKLK